ncbi:hypothetical protein [Aliiroseovarius marinus]|uniref:ImmA/IrrE family metallo-endopeptidase n=1 Tax=Aliiroseovarius marinus TaxID=2500159 RepID=UPI003D7E7366
MIELRRLFCSDDSYFRMSQVWDWLVGDDEENVDGYETTTVKWYKTQTRDPVKDSAGVVAFDGRSTLVAPEWMREEAENGGMFANFTLAHEFAHLALDHHARGAVVKNFQLFSGEFGNANIPPTVEELEANYAAVFFQCGVALLDPNIEATELAKRASSDDYLVKKLKKMCALEIFQTELSALNGRVERVIL